MTAQAPGRERAAHNGGATLGQLVANLSGDVQKLVRQEIELAKAEMRQEAARAGRAAGMFGGAGFASYMTVIMLTLAATFGLASWLGLGWSALIIAGVWAMIGLVLFAIGRNQARKFSAVPSQTVETLKEDVQWVRHPTRSETTSSRPAVTSARTSTGSPTEPVLPE